MKKGGVLQSDNNKWASIYFIKDRFEIKQGQVKITLDLTQFNQLLFAINEINEDLEQTAIKSALKDLHTKDKQQNS